MGQKYCIKALSEKILLEWSMKTNHISMRQKCAETKRFTKLDQRIYSYV